MATSKRVKIGMVLPRSLASESPNGIGGLVPADVELDHAGLGVIPDDRTKGSIFDLRGKKDVYLARVPEIVREKQWQGVALSGAPVELLNPGLLEELQARLRVPVTTAMNSCSAALKALGAKRVLVITPFDKTMDTMLGSYLAQHRLEAVFPATKPLRPGAEIPEGAKLTPDAVYSFTREAVKSAGKIDALYYQGPLSSREILQKVEENLGTPVVASTLGSLWYLLAKLGLKYQVRGAGRLMSEWPKLPA
jgi:hypothetical protein